MAKHNGQWAAALLVSTGLLLSAGNALAQVTLPPYVLAPVRDVVGRTVTQVTGGNIPADKVNFVTCTQDAILSTYAQCQGGLPRISIVVAPLGSPVPPASTRIPPLNVACKAPTVATLQAGAWACLVPASVKLSM
jgi:hypothetical protein